mgnify:CR=1 FL=1
MTHRIDQLRQTLRELETELEQVDSLDDESRQLLENAAADIHEALHKEEPLAESAAPQASRTWTDRLYDVAGDFEQSHPTLSRVVGNVANALAQLGI